MFSIRVITYDTDVEVIFIEQEADFRVFGRECSRVGPPLNKVCRWIRQGPGRLIEDTVKRDRLGDTNGRNNTLQTGRFVVDDNRRTRIGRELSECAGRNQDPEDEVTGACSYQGKHVSTRIQCLASHS